MEKLDTMMLADDLALSQDKILNGEQDFGAEAVYKNPQRRAADRHDLRVFDRHKRRNRDHRGDDQDDDPLP